MDFIKTAVRWRHGTFVLFCLLAIFGVLSLFRLPLELQPGGDRPEISISTPYPGASPQEVEELIVRPIEDVLEEVEGVQEITSSSRSGTSSITMEFDWGVDPDRKLLDVINKLQRVRNLPEEAGESSVQVVSGSDSPMMWLRLAAKEGAAGDSNEFRDLADRVVVPELRRVSGTSRFIVVGGQEREVEVRVDPKALADRDLSLGDVVSVLRENNRDIRGGPLTVGRREYRVRTVSRSENVDQFQEFVLRRDESGTVYLGDVAATRMGRKVRDSVFLNDGRPSVAIGVIRRGGANVPSVSQGVRATLDRLEQRFDAEGRGVGFDVPYDESKYIDQSINFMRSNLIGGALLATLVLLLFLGSLRTVAVIAISIPTTLITVFIVLAALGRSLNVIGLAGLGFAVGIVVDNAIVVLENVFTHLQRGKLPVRAAIDGTREVWGAMLASTLTTVAVFVPILLVEGEAGQLFSDIAIALSSAVLLSLLAALTLVPMLAGLFLSRAEAEQTHDAAHARGHSWLERQTFRASAYFQRFQGQVESGLLGIAEWSVGSGRTLRRLAMLAVPVGLLAVSALLLPPADYLPEGNRNIILWLMEPYPGTSVPEAERLSAPARAFVQSQPEVRTSFFIHSPSFKTIGIILKDRYATDRGLNAMVQRLMGQGFQYPGYRFVFPVRRPIFNDPGKEYEVRLIGPDLDRLAELEQQVQGQIRGLPGVANVRSDFVSGAPELQVVPQRVRLAETGLEAADVGAMVEAALGGRIASEFSDGKEEIDVSVELQDASVETPEELRQLPLYASDGNRVQLQDVAEVRETTGPNVINHVNLERSITLTVSLAPTAPLGALVDRTQTEILDPLRRETARDVRLELGGSADRLSEVLGQLSSVFLLSLAIVYLLLVALYRSFSYPMVIMATVPLGMTGAVLALAIVNWIPGKTVPFDTITGLGFVILTGIVVNNAILLVDRALQLQDEGIEFDISLVQAVKDRLRPIFMSAGTSVLGMLPLAAFPGPGAELYQGLGVALVGGLAVATVLTPTVVPALMGLLQDFKGAIAERFPQVTVRREDGYDESDLEMPSNVEPDRGPGREPDANGDGSVARPETGRSSNAPGAAIGTGNETNGTENDAPGETHRKRGPAESTGLGRDRR